MMQGLRFLRFLFLLTALLAVAAMDPPSQPIVLSPEQAAKEGGALVDEMLSQQPAESSTTGTMSIRTPKKFTQIQIKFQTILSSTNWMSDYQTVYADHVEHVLITHTPNQTNTYSQFGSNWGGDEKKIHLLDLAPNPVKDIWAPFAGSDFSIADLGLEFLHWPDQRLLQKEIKRSRSCRVLESINPHPVAGGYSRVKSWVDAESHGILYAEAYDVNGKELKEFYPKDFDKVDGEWQLHEMQISNVQTKSTTTVKFNLDR
jgi:outer membrane lipoprotein-sorting protein